MARLSVATFTGKVVLNGTQDTGHHAAPRSYISGLAAGASELKASVAATTVPASPLSTLSAYGQTSATVLTETAANGIFPDIDGVSPSLNNRYLLKDEADAENNGIWRLSTVGSGAAKWILTRADDSDTAAENTRGQFCWVDAGTINVNSGWLQTSVDVVTLGTDEITFAQVSGKQLLHADESTLTKSGDTISIKAAGITGTELAAAVAGDGLNGGAGDALSVDCATGLETTADAVKVSNAGVTSTHLNSSVAGAGLTGGGGSALAVGAGTGMEINTGKIAVHFGTTTGHALAGDADIVGGTWA
jgi:hypothetical protein